MNNGFDPNDVVVKFQIEFTFPDFKEFTPKISFGYLNKECPFVPDYPEI